MSRKALIIALFASLALNLFVIGVAAGGLIFGARMHMMRPQMRPGPALWAAGNVLPPQARTQYRRLLRDQGQEIRGSLREARALRRDAWAHMAEEPFDAQATRSALDRARALELGSRGEVEGRIVEFAARLSPDDRARLARSLASPPQHGAGPFRPGRPMDAPRPAPDAEPGS